MIKLENPCGGPGEEKTDLFWSNFYYFLSDFQGTCHSDEKVLTDLSDFDIVPSLSLSIHRDKSIIFLSLNKFIFIASKWHHEKVRNSTWFYFVTKLT